MTTSRFILSAIAIVIALGVTEASAQTVTINSSSVSDGGTLNASIYTSSIDTLAINYNDLVLNPSPSTTGFNFSGTTAAFPASTNGYFYSDYLINVTGSTAESVTTSLTNNSGVGSLNERIYAYNPSLGNNGFLGDTPAGSGILQAWSTNYVLPGTSLSYVSPTALTAGNYVVEIRGTSAGNFAGTLSVTAVPEPDALGMMISGLGLLGFIASRRKQS